MGFFISIDVTDVEVVLPEILNDFNHKELIWVHSDWLNSFEISPSQ